MSFPVVEEYISTYFVCKGTWIPITHCVLRSKNAKINEKYGYCSVCWEQDFKHNTSGANPESVAKYPTFKDSNINPKSGPCGCDTL